MAISDEFVDERPIVLVAMEGSPLLAGLRAALEDDYRTITCASGVAAVRLSELRADAVVIDASADGSALAAACRRIRAASPAAIVAAGSLTREADVARALDGGADDYAAAPFGGELAARIGALLRRASPTDNERTVVGPLTIDVARHTALLGGADLSLSGTEFALLAMLAHHRDRIVPREDLLSRIGVTPRDGTQHVLRVAMSRLRAKLRAGGPDGITIDATPGVGYQLVVRDGS